MTKTFIVKVTAKDGAGISGSRIANAVQMAAPHPAEREWHTECLEVVDAANTEVVGALYALGRKSGRVWKLLDFFNSERKATSALGKSVYNYTGCGLKGEFAMLEFSPAVGAWRVKGKSVKVG